MEFDDDSHAVKRPRLISDLTNNNNTELEYELLQGYRNFEHDLNQMRTEVARSGDIHLAVKSLQQIDTLFNKTSDISRGKNSLLAEDSRAVMNISELTSIGVRNIKLNESNKAINIQQILNSIKRFMLKDYFEINSIEEPIVNMDDGSNEELNEKDVNSIDDQDKLATSFFKKRQIQAKWLKQFDSYNEFYNFNWFKLGSLFQNLSKMPDTVDHLLGPLSIEKKLRASIRNRTREIIGTVITAEQVTSENLKSNQEETTPEQVKKCFQILIKKNGYNKINLFKFIIDPNSYGKSIENLFYTSFLIREKKLVLEDDENGFPAIRPKEPLPDNPDEKKLEIQKRNDAHQNHIIFQMDMPTWNKMITKFNIEEAFIS